MLSPEKHARASTHKSPRDQPSSSACPVLPFLFWHRGPPRPAAASPASRTGARRGLRAGRSRASISSSSGAAAIKMAVYRFRAQFSQEPTAFLFFPLQSLQAPAERKHWLRGGSLLGNYIRGDLRGLVQPQESDC